MSPLVIIFLTVFIDLLGFGIIIPLLPFYAESFGANGLMVGLLGSVFSLMQFTFAPVWGRWSDHIGRRPVILLGLLGSCVSYTALALASSLTLIFAARILGGIAGANIATAQAYIADVTTHENRARGMGLVGAAFGLGFVFGPALGGSLTHFGPSAPMWCAAALCLANFVAAWFLLPESRHGRPMAERMGRIAAFRGALLRPQLLVLLTLYFIVTAAFSSFEATFALFSERRFGFTAATIGYVFAFIGGVLALMQGVLVGRIVPRFGERRLIPIGLATMGLSIAAVPFAPGVPALMMALGALAVGMGLNSPSLSSMVSRVSDAADQGGVLGLAQSLGSLGRVVGPAWGGFLFDRFGLTIPYVSAATLMLVAFALALTSLSEPAAPRIESPVELEM